MTDPTPADPLGTLSVDDDIATMTFVRRLPYAVEVVWHALTDADHRAAWFGPTVIDGRTGGSIDMVPDDPPVPAEVKRMTGEILEWDPPHVLEHEWLQSVVEPSTVRYELRPDGDGTVLTFTHTGLSLRNAEGFIPGTHAYLDRLAAHLGDEPVPAWSERYAEVAPAYT